MIALCVWVVPFFQTVINNPLRGGRETRGNAHKLFPFGRRVGVKVVFHKKAINLLRVSWWFGSWAQPVFIRFKTSLPSNSNFIVFISDSYLMLESRLTLQHANHWFLFQLKSYALIFWCKSCNIIHCWFAWHWTKRKLWICFLPNEASLFLLLVSTSRLDGMKITAVFLPSRAGSR